MAKHTKGPWERGEYGGVIAGGNSVMFRSLNCLMAGSTERMSEAEANTTLVAAAPDLLAALQSMTEAPSGMSAEWYENIARAAIAKATAA